MSCGHVTRSLRNGSLLALITLSLVACGQKPITVREPYPVEVLVPVKQKLTRTHVSKVPVPRPPPANCRDNRGFRVPCNKDLTDYTQALLSVVNRLHAKLDEIEKITEVEGD